MKINNFLNLKNFDQKFKTNNNFFSRKFCKKVGIVESDGVSNDTIKKDKESVKIFYHVITIKNNIVNCSGPYKPLKLDFDKIKKEIIEESNNWKK